MTRQQAVGGGRRAPLPPSPLLDEIVRKRLVETLAARFDVPVTVLVAGAGFGKTTALAQAIRANEAAPRGIDAWVACEPGDEDAGRLSGAIVGALDAEVRGGSSLDRVASALSALAPIDVCLLLDDLHELPHGSAGEQLVCDLNTHLPPHVHLVLASRLPVPVALARRRAAGQVVEVGDEVLSFTDSEVSALARILGDDGRSCDGLAGWPSLVRLVLSAPAGATRQFLWEEIVARLTQPEQRALLALAVLGTGSADEVARVAGSSVDIRRLVGTVPLLHQDAQGTLGAHQLWEEAVERIFPVADVQVMRRRALRLLAERGETVRMGSSAVRWSDADMTRVASVALVRESLGVLPVETAERWLAGAPPAAADAPELRLLDLAVRFAQHCHDDGMDSELDVLEADFVERGDTDAQVVALALGAVSAHANNDMLRLISLTERIESLPGAHHQPELRFFIDAVDAAHASLAGDVEGCLRTIEAMSFDEVPSLVVELMVRLHATMLVMAGRADEAIPIARSLLESPHAYVRSIPAMLRWVAGDPGDYIATPLSMDALLVDNNLYRFVSAAHGAAVATSLGDRALVNLVRTELDGVGWDADARDSAIAAAALACCAILDHDEKAVLALIDGHLERYPIDHAPAEVRLRRHLAVVYVANAAARSYWDAADLGPLHLQARAVARHLLEAREGRLDPRVELGSPGTVVTVMPLPWSVELAIRASAAGCPDGSRLLRSLATWLPSPTRQEVAWLAANGDVTCRSEANRVLENMGDLTQQTLRVDILGPMRLRVGEGEAERPELRRSRVRTLLAVLVVRGRVRRESIGDLLWPDLEPEVAAQNLRVTLSRLRRLLEPVPSAGSHTTMIRGNGEFIELAGPPQVETDLALFRRCLADADQALDIGDSAEETARLAAAVDLWRGEPLLDLVSIDELAIEVESISRSLIDACLRLGELLGVAGRFEESLRCAERARSASPLSERAHRLAIACQLQRHDRAGLQSAMSLLDAMLTDLGVEAEPATAMLLRRAASRLSPPSRLDVGI